MTEGRKSEILKGLNHPGGSPASSEGEQGAYFLVLILLVGAVMVEELKSRNVLLVSPNGEEHDFV